MISFLSLPPLQVSPSLCLEVAPLSWGTCGSLCWPLLSFLCQSFSACPLLPLFVHLDKYLCAVSLIKWLSNSFCLIRPNVNSQTALWWLLSISSLIKSYFSFCNLGKWSTCSPGTDWFVFHVVTRPVIFFFPLLISHLFFCSSCYLSFSSRFARWTNLVFFDTEAKLFYANYSLTFYAVPGVCSSLSYLAHIVLEHPLEGILFCFCYIFTGPEYSRVLLGSSKPLFPSFFPPDFF